MTNDQFTTPTLTNTSLSSASLTTVSTTAPSLTQGATSTPTTSLVGFGVTWAEATFQWSAGLAWSHYQDDTTLV